MCKSQLWCLNALVRLVQFKRQQTSMALDEVFVYFAQKNTMMLGIASMSYIQKRGLFTVKVLRVGFFLSKLPFLL
jgi:hypothetical protein